MRNNSRSISLHRFNFIQTPSGFSHFARFLYADKDVVIAYVTSQMVVSPKIGDYKIQEWKAAGLPKPSMVRMKFATIDQTIVIKTIGEIEDFDREEIEKILLSFFKS